MLAIKYPSKKNYRRKEIMKKKLAIIVVCVLVMGMVIGCSAKPAEETSAAPAAAPAESKGIDYPTKPIKVICSFAAGGGNDTGLRILAKDAESELGVPIVVENKTGGGGWVGWDYVSKADPDGYTLAYIVSPNLITGYLNPTTQRAENLDSFEYIINHVDDGMTVAVRADDDRFNTIEDLVEYGKKTEIVAPSLGVAGTVHIAGLRMISDLGTKMRFVQFGGASEALTALLGGHVDIFLGKVTEVSGPKSEGQIKVLAILMPERNQKIADVPTIKEVFGVDMEVYSVRGLLAPKGTDPQIISKLSDAFEKAMNKPEHIQKMNDLGVSVNPIKGEAFKDKLRNEEKMLIDMKSLFGW